MMTTIEHSTELACALNGYRALIVPGINNSGADHWQSMWEHSIPRTRRILMHDWSSANWVAWRNSIIAALINIDEPVVIIAEGFGALAAASVAAEYPEKIIAALLVDPADPDAFDCRRRIPKQHISAPTKIVIRNQPFNSSALLAALWGTDLSNAPALAPTHFWPEGIQALQRLINKTQRSADEMTQARAKKVLAYLRSLKKAKHTATNLNFRFN